MDQAKEREDTVMTSSRLPRTLTLVALPFFAPVFANAQDVPRQCGRLAFADVLLDLNVNLFVDDELAFFREQSNIQQLTPDVERAVVTDRAVCRVVMREALRILNDRITPSSHTNLNQIDFAIFQYGPYYLVVTATKVPSRADAAIQGYGIKLVFRADPLEFLGWILG